MPPEKIEVVVARMETKLNRILDDLESGKEKFEKIDERLDAHQSIHDKNDGRLTSIVAIVSTSAAFLTIGVEIYLRVVLKV